MFNPRNCNKNKKYRRAEKLSKNSVIVAIQLPTDSKIFFFLFFVSLCFRWFFDPRRRNNVFHSFRIRFLSRVTFSTHNRKICRQFNLFFYAAVLSRNAWKSVDWTDRWKVFFETKAFIVVHALANRRNWFVENCFDCFFFVRLKEKFDTWNGTRRAKKQRLKYNNSSETQKIFRKCEYSFNHLNSTHHILLFFSTWSQCYARTNEWMNEKVERKKRSRKRCTWMSAQLKLSYEQRSYTCQQNESVTAKKRNKKNSEKQRNEHTERSANKTTKTSDEQN